jgi:hypothetical protein
VTDGRPLHTSLHHKRADAAKFAFKFIPAAQMADSLSKTMRAAGCRSVYLTKSPYMRPELREVLTLELSRHGVPVERPVSMDGISTEANFLERELAIKARAFVGEIGSSWSGTVCRKRQSRGVPPVMWTTGLHTCSEDGSGCQALSFDEGTCFR